MDGQFLQCIFQLSSLGDFVDLFIFADTNDDDQHLCFSADKLVNNPDPFTPEIDFQEIGEVIPALVS